MLNHENFDQYLDQDQLSEKFFDAEEIAENGLFKVIAGLIIITAGVEIPIDSAHIVLGASGGALSLYGAKNAFIGIRDQYRYGIKPHRTKNNS